jgi:hypothetical protein
MSGEAAPSLAWVIALPGRANRPRDPEATAGWPSWNAASSSSSVMGTRRKAPSGDGREDAGESATRAVCQDAA